MRTINPSVSRSFKNVKLGRKMEIALYIGVVMYF